MKNSIGSVRMRGLAKHLSTFNWNPIILTVNSNDDEYDQFKVFKTDQIDVVRQLTDNFGLKTDKPLEEIFESTFIGSTLINILYYLRNEFFAYPDEVKWWQQLALKKGKEILEEESIDAIISSSGPPTAHLIAKELKLRYNLPWIADFRDLWTQNHYYNRSPIRKYLDTRLEKRTLLHADALTTVSLPLANTLKILHSNKNVYTITNGFDSEHLNPGKPLSKKFSITYTGSLYNEKRDPILLFKALNSLISEGKIPFDDVEVNFFGPDFTSLKRKIEKGSRYNFVNFKGNISREEVFKEQCKSQILLLLLWNNPSEKGVYTGKLFDYLAAKRPILSIGSNCDVVTELLDETHAGKTVSNIEDLRTFLLESYNEYKSNGHVSYIGIDSELIKYTHFEMAKKFAEILDRISN